MNKKGFTLIELLATIAILVIMSLIIGVNITSILKSTEDNEKTNDRLTIEKAACVYVGLEVGKAVCNRGNNLNYSCTVNISKMVEEGLLDERFMDFTNKNVQVTWSSGEKTCTYNY